MDINENIGRIITLALEKKCKVLEQEPLSKYTTFKIGGNATALIIVESVPSLMFRNLSSATARIC